MATKMGIRQLRDSLTSALRRVEKGETIEVTHHGRPVAVLAPVPRNRIERLIAGGEVSRATRLEHPVRRHAPTGEMTASKALEEDRAER